MKYIEEYVHRIEEELEDAKYYAEEYLTAKARRDSDKATKYKAISQQELDHSNIIHEFAIADIEKLAQIYTAPVEMQEEWDRSHKKFIEKVSWIKQMLAM